MAAKKRRIEPVYIEFGAWFRRKRIFLCMTQEYVAKRVKISRASLVNIETGRQRVMLHDIVRLCGLVGTRWRLP
jgi:transcriptional regulator with XRE-family HTH domain